MKNFILLLALLIATFTEAAGYKDFRQDVKIGKGRPDASAALEVESTTKGFLPPRMTSVQRLAIVAPANGLAVYDTTAQLIYFYDGAGWAKASGESIQPWTTATGYSIDEIVSHLDFLYIIKTNHVSGVFATDLANNDIAELGDNLNRELNGTVADNALARWDGTGGDDVKTSSAILTDGGALSGLTQADVGNVQVSGNAVTTTNLNGNLVLSANGTGKVVISNDLQVDGTTTTVNSSTLEVTDHQITVNNNGNQATADTGGGIKVSMTDATDAVVVYDSSLASKFKAGEEGSEREIVTVSDTQTLTNKELSNTGALNANLALEITSTTKASSPCPTMTEAQRDLLTAVTGSCIYNSDQKKFNIYEGAVWVAAGGGIDLWTSGFAYKINDIIHINEFVYRAATAHTSGVFATDLGNGDWVELSDNLNRELNGSVVDNTIVRWDGTTGDDVKASNVVIDNSDNVTGVASLSATKLTVTSTADGSTPCPSMTEVQRDAIGAPVEGICIYNSTSKKLNVYDGTDWVSAGGGLSQWAATTGYKQHDVIWEIASNKIYRANADFTSGGAFVVGNWTELSPVIVANGLELTASGQAQVLGNVIDVANPFITINANGVYVPVLDEDNLVSDSDVHLPTQQSVKAYVDGATGGLGLQGVYDQSSDPLLTLSAGVGQFKIRDNSTPIGTDLFSVKDNGETTDFFKVDVNGTSTSGSSIADTFNFLGDSTNLTSTASKLDYVTANEIYSLSGNNYVEVANFEVGTTGITCSNVGLTVSRVTASPLRGTGMLRVTKAASNLQNEYCTIQAFSIERADQNKMAKVTFDFDGSAITSSGDWRVVIRDVDNAVDIHPFGGSLINSENEQKMSFPFSGSSNYELRLVVNTADATGYTVDWDTFTLRKDELATGMVIENWTPFTPTGTLTTNVTYTGLKRRIGDSLHIMAKATFSGATDATNLAFDLPAGLTEDTSKLSLYAVLGSATYYDVSSANGSGRKMGEVVYATPTLIGYVAFHLEASGNDHNTRVSTNFTIAAGDTIDATYIVPIQGWSSGVVIADSTEAKESATVRFFGGNGNGSTNTLIPRFDFYTFDSTNQVAASGATVDVGSFSCVDSATTGTVCTVKTSGVYSLSHGQNNISQTQTAWVTLNDTELGTNPTNMTDKIQVLCGNSGISGNSPDQPCTITLRLKTGDIVRPKTSFPENGASTRTNFFMTYHGVAPSHILIEDPASTTIIKEGSAPPIVAIYQNTAGQTVNNGTTILYTTLIDETQSGLMSAGVYTAPRDGWLKISAVVTTNAVVGGVGQYLALRVRKNAVDYRIGARDPVEFTGNVTKSASVSTVMRVSEGDTVLVNFQENITNSVSLITTGTANQVEFYLQ